MINTTSKASKAIPPFVHEANAPEDGLAALRVATVRFSKDAFAPLRSYFLFSSMGLATVASVPAMESRMRVSEMTFCML